jgi:hypothetical protein
VIEVEPACCRKKGLTAVFLQPYSIHHPQSEAASLSVCSDVHIASDSSGQRSEKVENGFFDVRRTWKGVV